MNDSKKSPVASGAEGKVHRGGDSKKRRKNKAPAFEITVFTKSAGILTKKISLTKDGSVLSDPSACWMEKGIAQRMPLEGVADLAALIGQLRSDQAIALGALRPGLSDEVKVTTKAKLNGAAVDVIARTGEDIIYRPEQPAFLLIDTDSKGMPAAVKARIKQLGGIWPVLLSVLPELRAVARVMRRSTSSGLSRSDTGEELPGSDNMHIYPAVKSGTDIERFLKEFHVRCWLAGLGWMIISKSGDLLERSLVDRMVGGPEHLVFEGAPPLERPIKQDKESRRPVAVEGDLLDTSVLFPPLTILEKSKFDELRAREAQRLEPEAAKVRKAYIEEKALELVKLKPEMTMFAARWIFERQCDAGVLLPSVVLPFDDDEFAGCTVGDVLADPDRFVEATLADPNEGISYGRCKAKILRRSDGTLFIHSFAHGRTFYDLKLDAAAVRAAIEEADEDKAAKVFAKSVVDADLDAQELEELRDLVAKRSGAGKRIVDKMLKEAKQENADKQAKRERKRRVAARTDPRPQIAVPFVDAPWLPEMRTLEDVLGTVSPLNEPPMRDADRIAARPRKLRVLNMHTLTQADTNAEPEEENSDD